MNSIGSAENFITFVQGLRSSNCRGLIVLSGNREEVQQAALALLAQLPSFGKERVLCDWIADDLPAVTHLQRRYLRHIHRAKARQLLGSDLQQVVINAYDGLSPNLLGVISGALSGGGLFILLTPSLQSWPQYNDPDYQRFMQASSMSCDKAQHLKGGFLRRFVKMLEQEAACARQGQQCIRIANAAEILNWPEFKYATTTEKENGATTFAERVQSIDSASSLQATSGQQQIVKAIRAIMLQPKAALLLTADRGRGKTTALGFAISKLLEEKAAISITLCAPIKANVQNALQIVNSQHVGAQHKLRLKFLPPDRLLKALEHSNDADLIIIDEAAAIVLPVLDKIAALASRIVFASTTSGYEGSGRGFILRFKTLLQSRFSQLEQLTLTSPIRWAASDGLEPFFNRLLCLAQPIATHELLLRRDAAASTQSTASATLEIKELSKPDLLGKEGLLEAVFAVLLNAHYQTRPDDLRYLLDTPYTRLWVALNKKVAGEVVGALLVCEEGGKPSDPALLEQVASGKRRPRGNMLAQLLTYQANNSQWYSQPSWRVMRIAVLAPQRRQGIAKRLIDAMALAARRAGCGYWGSLFGYDAALTGFWQTSHVIPVHLGLHRDKASAARNLAVVRLLPKGVATLGQSANQLANRLAVNLPVMRDNYFTELSATECEALMQWAQCQTENQSNAGEITQDDDRAQLHRFIEGDLGVDSIFAVLYRLQKHPEAQAIMGKQDALLPLFLAHAPNWQAIEMAMSSDELAGRRGVQKAIREQLALLYAAFN